MSSHLRALSAASLLALLLATGTVAGDARADEGQWMPEQISALDHGSLRERGLERSAQELWDPEGGGLMRGAVNLSGCSASFVSAEGLVITNHHCAYAALQAASTVERDLLKDGFLAKTRADEEPAKGRTVRIVERIDDVSEAVLAAAAGASDDRGRLRAVRAKRRELVKACDAEAPGRRCQVSSFFGGSQYRLTAYKELEDVRLVYAPPSSIGEFGGEVDNWMWPRHTGDFAILRAYAGPEGEPRAYAEDNVPYRPEHWLKVADEGVCEGGFVAVLGYPGQTTRYLWFTELARRMEQDLPAKIDLYGEWIAIAEELGSADPAVAIKVASTKKSLANVHKNSRGMLEGVARMGLIERRRQEEERLAEADKGGVLEALREETARTRRSFMGDFLRGRAAQGPTLVDAAVDVVRWAREQRRPEAQRANGYLDRDRERLWRGIQRRVRDHDVGLEANLLAAVLARTAQLPEESQSPALRALIGGARGERSAFVPATRKLLKGTKLADVELLRQLFDEADPEALRGSKDPLLRLANQLADELEAVEEEGERRSGALLELKPAYFELLRTVREGPLYPDANGTLRISVASVRGYAPRDGLVATPKTTLSGQLAKVTGETPFALPERVSAKADGAAESYWADPELEDLAICLLSDGDTTGGNSGSAVINGRGEVIGLNFDRVWENIAGDVAYDPRRSRNIIVDIRYLFWLLDQVEEGGALLDELGVGGHRGEPRRQVPKDDAEPRSVVSVIRSEPELERSGGELSLSARAGCGCSAGGGVDPWALGGWALLLLAPLAARRRPPR